MLRKIHKGFTLIELMIVVAIIGILAAIALPVYNTYTIRSKASELLIAASSFRVGVTEKAVSDSTIASAGIGLTVATGGRVAGGLVTNTGVITILGNNVTLGTDVTVVLTPTLTGQRINWDCGNGNTSATWKYLPAECRH